MREEEECSRPNWYKGQVVCLVCALPCPKGTSGGGALRVLRGVTPDS
jgi:hypothetical protein